MRKLVSVIIRTFNEERYLEELLMAIERQQRSRYDIEVVLVDSGSTDRTIEIARHFDCRITYIKKEEFSFGRSLNVGCRAARGEFLTFISGHCVPCNSLWIEHLVAPLENECVYTYGRQIGRDTTKFSEMQLFEKYFPAQSRIPQNGIFINNANSALRKEVWERFLFDEELTGCEDMFLARLIVNADLKLGYVAEAAVYHIHDERWQQVELRYEREAVALQRILPEIHVNIFDTIKYIAVGVVKDVKAAISRGVLRNEFLSIIRFRYCQYMGAYKGNKSHRVLSSKTKKKYFYPRISNIDIE